MSTTLIPRVGTGLLADDLWNKLVGNPWSLMGNMNPSGLLQNFSEETTRFSTTADGLTIEVDLPGVKKEDTIIEVGKDDVYVSAKRIVRSQSGQREETFTRSYTVNRDFDIDLLNAKQEDGVLTITAPRKASTKDKLKRVQIK
jgi:HSP20 family molecular chaperone IbpA